MKLLVVGATGTLGRQIVRSALAEGHQVKCLVRSYKRANFLKEWGAELIAGDLCEPETLTEAMAGAEAVIDAATVRPTDSQSIKQTDWFGKVALIQATIKANIKRFIFISFLDTDKYPQVPLLEAKRCTELFLAESGLDYTILRPCGFLQELISLYAIPILEGQSVWISSGQASPIAYMDAQDVAKFAVTALTVPETIGQIFPVVGPRAWSAEEIIKLCEKLSDKEAKIVRTPNGLLKLTRTITKFFQWTWNISDRLAFAEVLATGRPLNAQMDQVYQVFGLDPQQTTTLESYMQEYFSMMIKKIKQIEYQQNKPKKKGAPNVPFF